MAVPVSRRLSAHRHSLLGHPVPAEGSAFLTVGPPSRHAARTPSGFPRSTRVRHDRGGRPLNPGDGGVLPAGGSAVRPAPAASHPSGLPLACGPRTDRRPSGFFPELRTPPLPATHVRAGTGLSDTDPGYTFDMSRTSNRCNHSTRATSCRTLPAFPGRSRPATGSPDPAGPWSTNPTSGWCP